MKDKILTRFLRYVRIDTQSDENSTTYPSTQKQMDLARLLEDELKTLGLKDVNLDHYGYVTATLPTNTTKDIPVIGFFAHMDTAPDMSGKNVKPQVFEHYDGKDISINKASGVKLSVQDFPELKNYTGQTIITASGDTLLGADDKAGIAEIMTAIEFLIKNPEIKHGTIKIAFTPDEEIGKGIDHFDVQKFGADYAYTIDGGPVGELEYENFNAASAKIRIRGCNIHPGYARGRMINAILVAAEMNSMLPIEQRPELTRDYEGFFHIVKFNATVEHAEIEYIIRDHHPEKFRQKKKLIESIVTLTNQKYHQEIATLEIKDQYYNMRKKIEPVMHIVEHAKQAMLELGITPRIQPIRGGTDGARLSYMGLPCPNLFTGGHNYHGRYEFIPLESMEKAVKVILKIIEISVI
ncbi:MAG: peptidase T [Bacteroidales bacterium]|jgi:tripeptide aminopeptidase|nr:peptidase T [Bacteroidales bacterium]